MPELLLMFVAGKDQGREIPLRPDQQISIGRSSEADLLLVDEKVSRNHARLSTMNGQVVIEDLGSRNGTLVNGQRIRLATALKEGDYISIGTSTMKLMLTGGAAPGADVEPTGPAGAIGPSPAESPAKLMSGALAEVPLADLLQMLSGARKHGVLTIRSPQGVGHVWLRDGQVQYAALETNPAIPPRKAFHRMLRWSDGRFDLEAAGAPPPDELQESTTALLLEGLQQWDELKLLEPNLPPPGAALSVPLAVTGSLRQLATDEVQIYELALSHGNVQDVLDRFSGSDLEACTCLLNLLRRGVIVVG
jgi:hypothetical protein